MNLRSNSMAPLWDTHCQLSGTEPPGPRSVYNCELILPRTSASGDKLKWRVGIISSSEMYSTMQCTLYTHIQCSLKLFTKTVVIIWFQSIIYLPSNQILCQHWGSRALIPETVEVINNIIISDLRRYQSRPIRALINIQCLNRNNQKNVKYADLIVFLSIFEIYFPCDNNKDSPDGRLSAVRQGLVPVV